MVNKKFNSSKKTSKRKISNFKRAAANTRWENSCQGFFMNDYLLSRIQKKQIKIEDIGKWNNYKIKSHFCTGRINGDKCCQSVEDFKFLQKKKNENGEKYWSVMNALKKRKKNFEK